MSSPKAIASATSSPAAAGAFLQGDGSPVALGYVMLELTVPAASLTGGGEVSRLPAKKISLDVNGVPSAGQTLYASDQFASPVNPAYRVRVHNANDLMIGDLGNCVISGVAPVDLTTLVASSGGVSYSGAVLLNPGANQTISTGNLAITNNLTVSGNVTEIAGQNQYKAYSFNSVLWVDGIKYTTVMGAYADLPSTGGCVMVPPNYSETVAASWTLSKAYSAIVFTGPATMNFGSNTITVPVGIHGVKIKSEIPWGSFVTVTGTGVEFNYTGSGTFVTVGASSADTYGFRMEDICVFTNNAGSAAIGTKLVRCPSYEISSTRYIGPGGAVTQQAIILDGTGNFTGGIIYAPLVTGYLKGIQLTGSGVNAGNANEIIGGSVASPATGTSLGIDFQQGSGGNVIYGTDIEGHAVGYNFGGTSQGNVVFGRSETNTSAATFASGTIGNEVHIINSLDPFTLGGTGNSVINLSNSGPARIDLTGQTAAIGTTTIYAVPAGGAAQYRLSWNAKITTAAGVSSTLGGLTLIYTDPDGNAITTNVGAMTSGGAIANTATTNNLATFLNGVPVLINAKGGTNIQYSFAYASNAANAMTYNFHLRLEPVL